MFPVRLNVQGSANPLSQVETGILMIEKVGTVNTGDREGDERTVRVDEAS